ncbi:MAG: DUF1972 domain-containing protein, partial [Betaproteobacteria bacterium]|nr:DUF1972 domain-containing protein [Betaproteobacteria bacterium]
MTAKTVRILGTHGVPANYGGFETAAENIGFYLVSRGWRVIVYCQVPGTGAVIEDRWNGIERVLIPMHLLGWKGTSKFDWIAIRHASKFRDLCLTFGYNTAIFNTLQRLKLAWRMRATRVGAPISMPSRSEKEPASLKN